MPARPWSAVKKALEERLAVRLQGRVQYHATRYRGAHARQAGRGWITLDKRELVDMSTLRWARDYYQLAGELRALDGAEDWRDPAKKEAYYEAGRRAEDILQQQGVFGLSDFYAALESYLSLAIDAALAAPHPLIRAVAMFDARLGKRRLAKIRLEDLDHALVREFFLIRCQAEGIRPGTQAD